MEAAPGVRSSLWGTLLVVLKLSVLVSRGGGHCRAAGSRRPVPAGGMRWLPPCWCSPTALRSPNCKPQCRNFLYREKSCGFSIVFPVQRLTIRSTAPNRDSSAG